MSSSPYKKALMYYKVKNKQKVTQAKSRKIHCKTYFVPYTDQGITKYFRFDHFNKSMAFSEVNGYQLSSRWLPLNQHPVEMSSHRKHPVHCKFLEIMCRH